MFINQGESKKKGAIHSHTRSMSSSVRASGQPVEVSPKNPLYLLQAEDTTNLTEDEELYMKLIFKYCSSEGSLTGFLSQEVFKKALVYFIEAFESKTFIGYKGV